jgi:PST family polysaccharide transporter
MAVSLSTMLVESIIQVAVPAFSRLQAKAEQLKVAYYKGTEYAATIAFPAFLGLAAVAPEFISVWFGPRWMPSVRVSQVLAILAVTWMTGKFNGVALQALGAVRTQFWLRMFGTLTNLAAIVYALRWGINGVAYAMLGRALILAPVSAFFVRRYTHVDYGLVTRQVLPPLIGALASVACVSAVRALFHGQHPALIMAIGVPLGATVYVGIIRVIAPALFADVSGLLRRLVSRRAQAARPAPQTV